MTTDTNGGPDATGAVAPTADVSTAVAPTADVSAREEAGRWVLVFRRDLAHPPERVWDALTDPGQLAEWAPFDASRDLGSPGPATLSSVGSDEVEASRITVRVADRPRVLEYTWDDDLLRWELEPSDRGTRLTLSHHMGDPSWLSKVAAGWDVCLRVADRYLDGRPVGRTVGESAKAMGWDALNEAYGRILAGDSRRAADAGAAPDPG